MVLRKPQKPDYAEAKAFRPIALLNTLGKLLEWIVADRIAAATEEHHLLPDTQMGARRNRSSVAALELLTEQIHTVWAQDPGLVASVLSLDISGAYDHVSHERLLHNLRKARLPRWICEFTRSFLSDRVTYLAFAGFNSEAIPTTNGIPQGSSLSPILFLFFASELLLKLGGDTISALGFVDDTNIITFSRSTEDNCRALEEAHKECEEWARTHGSHFAPDKYVLTHFTRHRKRFNMEAKVNITGFSGEPSPVVKILGILVDDKLKWGPHIKATAAKASSQMASLTRLAASTWGASFQRARHVYSAVVRPVLSYGCAVWHTPEGITGAKKTAVKPLEKVQNAGLRAITGAYKTTEVQVLEHEAGIAPLTNHLSELALVHATRYRTGDVAIVMAEACNKIRQTARARFAPRRIPGPPRRLLVRAAAARVVGSPDPNKTTEERQKMEKATLHRVMKEAWRKKWEQQLAQERRYRSAAKAAAWDPNIHKLHKPLTKAQSTMATLIRTEHIGLEDYLYRRRVPGHETPACACGWQRQTPKHVLIFCPKFREGRSRMLAEAKTADYHTLVSSALGIRAAATWLINKGILNQFSLAREMQQEDKGARGREESDRGELGPEDDASGEATICTREV